MTRSHHAPLTARAADLLQSTTMRITTLLLLVVTAIGVVVGLIEGYRVAGGLVVLMAGMLLIVGIAALTVVTAVRRERRHQTRRSEPPTDP
jgi:cell division protein FtsL